MSPQEWLKKLSQDGSKVLSDFDLSVLSLLEKHQTETLWTLLVLLSACFADLAKAGQFPSLPVKWDPSEVGPTFMHLSNTMDEWVRLLNVPGKEPLGLPEFAPSIPQEGQ